MNDYKLKLRNLHVSYTLGWSWNWNQGGYDSIRGAGFTKTKEFTRLTYTGLVVEMEQRIHILRGFFKKEKEMKKRVFSSSLFFFSPFFT
jgi:hypothetical protein